FNGISAYGDCRDSFGPLPGQGGPAVDASGCSFSRQFFDNVRAQPNLFSGVTAFGGQMELNLSGNGAASIVRGQIGSSSYFDTLGVRPAAGRMIESSDDAPDAPPVLVLSYGYWQRAFGGSLMALGEKIGLNGVPATIVGVAEPRFVSLTPGNVAEAWVPLSLR